MKFTINWEVDDGYAGGDRPHYTDISIDEFDGSETVEEIESIINDAVEDGFRQSIHLYIKNAAEVAAEIHAALQERREAEGDE